MNLQIVNKKNEVKSLIKLINKYFWKTKTGPIFSIGFPVTYLLLFFLIAISKGSFIQFASSLAGYISLTIVPICLMTLPALNIDFRQSILLRKIKTNNISKSLYIFILSLYFFILSLILTFLILMVFLLFSINNFRYLKQINWGSVVYSIFALTLISIATGLLISNIFKSIISVQLIGFALMIFSLIFSFIFLPITLLGQIPMMRYLTLFFPISYPINLINLAASITDYNNIYEIINKFEGLGITIQHPIITSNSIFNYSKDYYFSIISFNFSPTKVLEKDFIKLDNIVIYTVWQKIFYAYFIYIWTGLFFYLSIRFFKWTNR